MTESLICRSPFPYTASQLFALFADEKDVAFLDSSLVNDLGCYSLIGLVPYHTVSVAQGQLQVDGKSHEGTAETYLKAYLKKHYQANRTSLPLTAGAIGYVSYDYGLALHGMKSRHTPAFPLPDMKWVFYDFFIIEHRQSHTVWFAANGQTMPAEALLAQMEEKIRTRLQERPSSRTSENPQYALAVQADSTPESYRKALQKLRDYLFAGDVYVTNFTSTLIVQSCCPPYTFFSRLRRDNPSPFGAYLQYGSYQIISASMERLLCLRDDQIETRPIKGTRRRGKTPTEDKKLRQELAQSQKDQSELLMIVDLERNDLHKICRPGSVSVPTLFAIEPYATVFHLVANVTGTLRPGQTAIDALMALFPGGSITGAPKRRAMEIIDELEFSRRQLYTGTIGYLSLNGNCDLNIIIRTAVHHDDRYTIGVGGGITAESDVHFEYEEIWQKAKALLSALKGDVFDYESYL
ncbi:aminodeoxychorismate synthase component I [Megasphaera elsdenii]|uniref:aminodeoxychorismate synthase component I n=1 Tax=Megasphaera elsdenii TaxID=907 RepID=UPI002E782B3A|nr:aminodeoxychorismate synthase component I [Megasphaera elsdenii]MEE0403314.1 aminodeoxychorismate synthase component I [Megasphaera elsdenii]